MKLDDPRFAIWQQNPEQIFYRHLFYFNNISHADRPQWGQNFQAYLSDRVARLAGASGGKPP